MPFKGFWALPGGRVDIGETVEQAIVREVKEETGLDVRVVGKVGEYHEQGFQDGVEYNYYPACFLVNNVKGELKKQEAEIEEIRLFNLSKLPETLAFEHAQMIEDFVSKRYQKRKNKLATQILHSRNDNKAFLKDK